MDAVLLSHPDIAEAVAFGVPDDKYGEEVSNQIKLPPLVFLSLLSTPLHLNGHDPRRTIVLRLFCGHTGSHVDMTAFLILILFAKFRYPMIFILNRNIMSLTFEKI